MIDRTLIPESVTYILFNFALIPMPAGFAVAGSVTVWVTVLVTPPMTETVLRP